VRRAGLSRTNQDRNDFDWKVPTGVATTHEFALYGIHKADDAFSRIAVRLLGSDKVYLLIWRVIYAWWWCCGKGILFRYEPRLSANQTRKATMQT
jgi:hypothetical protein